MKFTTLALAGLLAVSFTGSAFAGSCCAAKKAEAAPVAKKEGTCPSTDAKDCPTTGSKKAEGIAKVAPKQ